LEKIFCVAWFFLGSEKEEAVFDRKAAHTLTADPMVPQASVDT
jgi:hypothetical protein